MNIKPIKTEADYRAALKAVESLMNAKAGTPEGARLDALATLIERYEDERCPMKRPVPAEAVKFEKERKGMNAKAAFD